MCNCEFKNDDPVKVLLTGQEGTVIRVDRYMGTCDIEFPAGSISTHEFDEISKA